MAFAGIEMGIVRILSVLENEVLLQTGLRDKIETMKRRLRFMKSFLEQHGNSSIDNTKDSVFATFVTETRDLAFKIETIIDEFSYHINRRSGQSKLKRAAHHPLYLWKRRCMVGDVEEMCRKVQEMSDSMETFRSETPQGALPVAHDVAGDTKWVKNLQESSFFVGDESLVGIDEDKEKLTDWLLESERRRTVVTVVGMGGSGKTTLAGNIFRSQRVRTRFDCRSWVTISQSYDIEDVFRTMIKDIFKELGLSVPTDLPSMRYRELVEMLVEYLQGKAYLIVLDDVWKTDFWKEISVALPDGARGSRVMITSRDDRLADLNYGTTSRSHRVEPLSEDKAWELFGKKAFPRNPEQSVASNIEPIARSLVKKCQGLPLAIVALGSMMSTRKSVSERRYVQERLNQELRDNPNLRAVRSILVLSFSDLPLWLRHCFLYCCVFPEDYIIRKTKLIRMWMAHGFVEPNRGTKLEDIADSYLMELVYRNMLEVVSRNVHGQPKEFKMHDIIREISLTISRDQKFCDVYDRDEAVETRHLCIRREISPSTRLRSLHTLFVCSTSDENIALPTGLKFLTILDLEDSGIDKLPDSVSTLYNLKYFNVARTQVRKLPRSFHRLHNLETLITKNSRIKELPAEISKFENLRCLSTFNRDRDWSRSPLGMEVSSDICQLKRLQVMERIYAKDELVKNIGNMTQLTKINLTKVKRDQGKDLCDSLSKLKDLRSLSLRSISKDEHLAIEALSPTTNIEKLELMGKLERVPSWFETLHNLTQLEMISSSLRDDPIPCIQALPNLFKLRLFEAYETENLCFAEGFRSLKALSIGAMPQLTNVIIQNGAMPDLQVLHIVECRGVERVPHGIESLTKLQVLYLSSVSDELSESIRDEKSVDRSKVKHIPTITLRVFDMESGALTFEKIS